MIKVSNKIIGALMDLEIELEELRNVYAGEVMDEALELFEKVERIIKTEPMSSDECLPSSK